jgi:hypothetical protein
MRASPSARGLAASLISAAALVRSAPARATEFEVNADTAAQGYSLTSPWGDTTIDRRRFLQTVGLGVYNLQGNYHPGEADYRVVVGVRIDADFGINGQLPTAQAGGETNYHTSAGNGVRYVPGLQVAPIDVMYGYVEGRNLAHGVFGFRIGRQYVTDALGLWAFDGGLFRVNTPAYVAIEAYGGLEERGGLPLSTPRFERQGVWRGDHQNFASGADTPAVTDYPSFLVANVAPAFGFAVESHGPNWVHSRFTYRHVFNTGDALTSPYQDGASGGYRQISGLRTSQERVGWAGDVTKPDLGTLKGGFTYDLYDQIVGSYFASAEAYLGKRVTVGADADYFVPTFDGDSIWNWFTHGPITTLTGRVAIRATKRLNVTASGGARLWWTEGDASPGAGGLSVFGANECAAAAKSQPTGAVPGAIKCTIGQTWFDPATAPIQSFTQSAANRPTMTTVDAIGNLNGRYRFASGDVGLKGMIETGARGNREGADVSGEKRWDGGRYLTGARVSVYGWADPTRPDRDAVSFAYVLAGGFRPAEIANMRVEWEQDTNRLVGQRYRVMAVLNLRVLK